MSICTRYLPPYTSFIPMKDGMQDSDEKIQKRRGKVVENLIFSQLSYLVIFIILVCITERKKLKEDPLNFNVLNIVIEVVRLGFFQFVPVPTFPIPFNFLINPTITFRLLKSNALFIKILFTPQYSFPGYWLIRHFDFAFCFSLLDTPSCLCFYILVIII